MTSLYDDPCEGYHAGHPLSVAAHTSIIPEKQRLRDSIASYIRLQGAHGATCDEVELALGLTHQCASARLTELHRDCNGQVPVIVDSGQRRATRSGRKATVYWAK